MNSFCSLISPAKLLPHPISQFSRLLPSVPPPRDTRWLEDHDNILLLFPLLDSTLVSQFMLRAFLANSFLLMCVCVCVWKNRDPWMLPSENDLGSCLLIWHGTCSYYKWSWLSDLGTGLFPQSQCQVRGWKRTLFLIPQSISAIDNPFILRLSTL